MADQSVKINVGSSYDGSGMNKAMGAVNTLSRTAGKAAGAVGRIGAALGGISGEAGKAVGAIASFAGAFATGGVFGVAIAGVTALVGAWQNHNDKVEEAKKKNKELEIENLTKHINEYADAVEKAASKLDALTRAQNGFATARQKTLVARAQNEADDIRTAAAGKGPVAEAQANLEATKIEQKANVDAADVAVKNAAKDFNAATKNLATAAKKLEDLTNEYNMYKSEVKLGMRTSDPEVVAKYEKALDEAKERVKKYDKAQTDAANAGTLAKELKIKAEKAQTVAIKKATEAVENATAADTYAYQEKLNAIEEEAQKNEEIARAKIALAEAVKKEADAHEAAALATEAGDYRNKLQQWNDAQDEADQLVKLMKDIQSDLKNKNLNEQQRAERMAQLREINIKLEDIKKKNPNVNVAVNVGGGNGGNGGGGNGGGNMPNVHDVLDGNNPNSPFQPRNDFGSFRKPKGHDQRKIKSHANWLRKRGFDPDDLLKQLGEDPTKKIAGNTDKIVQMMQNGGLK